MRTDLAMTGVGMLTPIGQSASVSMHSVRSAVSRLTTQGIPDRAKEPVVGGRIMSWTPYVRARHLQALAELALRQALRHARIVTDTQVDLAVILGAPEAIRPGVRFPGADFDSTAWLTAQNVGPVAHIEVVEAGAASAHLGLHRAVQLIESGKASACLIGVTDTQLHLRVTRWHEDNYRLKCAYLTDGLMPGEATCFLVIEPLERALARGAPVLARVLSVAGGREPATVLSDRPNTAAALTRAVRSVLTEAGVAATDIGMIWSDLNGESYRAREWAFTEIRLKFETHTELVHPADCHGDVGAASGATLLGLAALSHSTGWSDGKPALVFCGSEDGLRAAAILAPPAAGGPSLQISTGVPRVLSTDFQLPPPPDPAEDFRDGDDPPRAYFESQLREEHRDELASLYYQRNTILHDATIPWTRLRDVEQRILNHLDAAVASGPASMAVVAAGVATEEEGLCFGGAFLIGTIPTQDNLGLIRDALEPPTEPRLAGIAAGLVHAPDSEALRRLVRDLIEKESAAIQALAVVVAGARRIDIRAQLPRLLGSTDANLLTASADACRTLAVEEAVAGLQALLSHQRPDVRKAAILALLRILPGPTAAYARASIDANTDFAGALATCVGIAGQVHDAPMLIDRLRTSPGDRAAVESLGVLGAPASVPFLISLLASDDEDVKLAAAAALDLMSGLHARERVTVAIPSDVGEEASAEEQEIERVNTSRDFWTKWWHEQRTKLDADVRWRRGEYFTVGSCIDELADALATLTARRRAHLELGARAPVDFPFEPDSFVPLQDESIRAWRSWWAKQDRR